MSCKGYLRSKTPLNWPSAIRFARCRTNPGASSGYGMRTRRLLIILNLMLRRTFDEMGPRSVAENIPFRFKSLRQANHEVLPTASKTRPNVSPIAVRSSSS
jgi:hypothetical protein